MIGRRAVVVGVSACAVGTLVLLAAPRAGAHALLERADPGDGAALQVAPRAAVLTFSEAPDPDLSRIEVLDTSGTRFQQGASAVDGRTIRVDLRALDDGVYTVSWRVVSRVDGHLTAGAFAFGVGVSPSEIDEASADAAAASTAAFTLSGVEVGARVVLYAGLILLVGGAWVYGFAFRTRPAGARGVMLAGAIVAVDGVILLAFAQQRAAGAPLGSFLGTAVGAAIVQRAIGVGVAALAAIAGWFDTKARRVAWDVSGVAAASVFFVHAGSGHAAAGGLVLLKVLAQFVHMTAVGIWIGGLFALLVGISAVDAAERLRAVRRFSAVAAVTLLIVTATGVARAVQEVGSWSALVSTGYGRIVLGKGAGLVALATFGALNRYRNVDRAEQDPRALVRTSRFELSTSVVVLLLAALLASLAPAKSSAAKPSSSVVVEGSDFARDVSVRLEITPGRPGVNAFSVDAQTEDDEPVRGVTVRFTPASGDVEPTRVELERIGGRWTGRGSAITTPGRWRAVVTVDRGADSVEVLLRFRTACPPATGQDAGDLRLYTIDLSGRSVQAYVDPARPGNNEVHFTLFDEDGQELPLDGIGTVTAARSDRVLELGPRKLSPGHVIAGERLSSGRWVFDFVGMTEGGEAVNVCFEEVIG